MSEEKPDQQHTFAQPISNTPMPNATYRASREHFTSPDDPQTPRRQAPVKRTMVLSPSPASSSVTPSPSPDTMAPYDMQIHTMFVEKTKTLAILPPNTDLRSGPPTHLLRMKEDRDPVYKCPFTNYPNLIWLKTPAAKSIIFNNRELLEAIILDRTIQVIIFHNGPEYVAREKSGDMPAKILTTPKRKHTSLRDKRVLDPLMEVVVTNIGGERPSKVLAHLYMVCKHWLRAGQPPVPSDTGGYF